MSYRFPLTILLIDDCAEDRVAYCRFLQQDSVYTYRIFEFETATEAINWCQQEIPDVILLNFFLPDRNGLEFLGQFREHISSTQAAAIVLTGQGDADSAVHAMKSGAQDYLVKDKLTPQILQRSIHSAVERMHLTRQLKQSQEQQQMIAGQEALRESEERFRSTFEQVAVGMCHVSFDGHFLRFNQRFCDIAGYSSAELLTLTFQEITHPDDLAFDLEMMQNLLRGKIQTYSLEKRYIRKDRSLIWSTLTVSLVRDRFGEPKYLISVVEDITSRKQAEEALRRTEAKNRAILAAIPDLIFQTNAEGVYLRYVTPYRTSDLLPPTVDPTGRRLSDVLPPDIAQRHMAGIERALNTNELQTYEQQVQIGERLQDEEIRVIKSGNNEVLFMIRDISDRKQAEAALLQLAAIVESSDDAIISKTLDGVIVSWNAGAQRLFGYTAEEVIGQSILLLIPPDRKIEESQILEKIKRGEGIEHFETVRQRKDGTLVDISLTISPVKDATGKVIGASKIARDVSARKQAEEELRRSEKLRSELHLLENILEVSLAGYFDWDIPSYQEYLSPTFKRMFGYEDHELPNTPETWQRLIFPEDLLGVLECFDQHVKSRGQIPYYNEVRYRHKDGSTVWVICSGRVIEWDRDGNPLRMIGCHIDITERKQAEQALKESEERWQLALRGSNDGIWDWNAKTNRVFVSTRWKQMRGFADDEIGDYITCEEWSDAIHPDDRDRVLTALDDHLAQKTPFFRQEYQVQRQDGSYMWILDRGQALWDEAGNAVRMAGSESDISDAYRQASQRKQIEQALKESEALHRTIVEDQTELIARFLPDSTLVFVNEAYCRYFGLQREKIIGKSYEPVILEEDRETVTQLLQSLSRENPTVTIENRVITKGEIRWTQWINRMLFDAQGQFVELQSVGRDITQLKQTEEALRISEEQLRTLSERLTLALKSGGFGIWEYDFVQNQQIWDDRMYELYGVTPENFTLTYEVWVNCLHPDDRHEVLETIQQVVHENKEYNAQFRIVQPSGEIRFLRAYGVLQRDDQGKPIRIVGVNFDITARKQAEDALKESERRFATLAEASPVAIFRFDSQGNCVYVNHRWCEMTGRSAQEGLGLGWVQTLHPEECDRTLLKWSQWIQVCKGKEIFQNETRILRPDGSIIWVYCQMLAETDPDGTIRGYVGILADISDRKQSEEQLQNLSDRLSLALKSGAIGIWEWDVVRDVLIWDDRLYEMYGLQPSDLIGTLDEAWTKGVHPDDLAQVKATVRQSLQGEKEFDTEFRVVHPDGTIRFLKAYALVQRNEQSEAQYMVGINFDITDRKLAQQELEESRTMLQSVLDTIPQRVFWKDRQSRYLGCNPAFAHDYQLTPDAIIGKTDLELPRAQWAHLYREDDAVVIKTRTPKLGYEEQTEGFNGEQLWLRTSKVPLTNSAGDVIGVLGSYEDITDRKQAQEALAKYAHEVEDLYNNAPCGYHSLDSEGRFININETELRWLGYTREEILGKPFTDFITEAGHSVFEENYPRFKERGWVKDLEYDMVCKDGTLLPVLLNATAVKSADGTYLYNRATLFDIRDRKQAQQELQELNTAMQNAVEGISRVNIHGHYISINRSYANLCGYEPEELIGQPWEQTVYSEDIPDLIAAYQQMLETGKVEAEARGIRKDGSLFYKQVTMVTIEDEEGTVTGHHCFMKDISDRKYAEAQLRQTNAQLVRATRMKDEFLANMSHELRTPLNAILGMSEGLQESVFGAVNERQLKAIEIIERSGKHLLELINDILDLSKIESGKLELQISDVWVKSLCDGSLAFIKQMALKKNIHLSTRIPDNIGSIQADNRRLRQLLINLLSNAVKFTPENGSVTLEVRIEQAGKAGEANSPLSPLSPSPSHLCFCVRDTGIGIAPEDMGKLFQAFVQIDSSLNRQYTGTGLGLALVQSIAALHGGTVSVESEVGRGSCFTVRIPYPANGEVARMQAATPLPNCSFPVDNARVLIIEDSLAAAEQIARYLSECGMQPIIYPHGEGAIEEVLRVKPSLAILDIQLPNLSGWNVLTQLKTHPQTRDIPVLIVSVVDERSKAMALGASEYLVKPVNREEFQATLRKLQYPTVPESTPPIAVPEPTSQLPLILLAEDNQANIETISGYLESRGYRLILANDGQQAVALAKAQRPNLILMDIQMPGMDGLEAMRRIREEGQTHIPIIALTALAMPSDREKCIEAGANEYLAKPIKLKQLVTTIQQLLLQSNGNPA